MKKTENKKLILSIIAPWRPFRSGDEPALIEMCRSLNEEDPAAQNVPHSHMIRTLHELAKEPARGRAIVLEIDEQAVGYALLISFWSNELGGVVCTLDELFVRPAYRGQRYMTSLIADLTKQSDVPSDKPVAFELEVSPKNSKARALYERLGFSTIQNQVMRWKR